MPDDKKLPPWMAGAKAQPIKMVVKDEAVQIISLTSQIITNTLGGQQMMFIGLGDNGQLYNWDGPSRSWMIAEETKGEL